jgi:hypothetical protein|tara:strand:- start:811 stop:1791 length:981 start_codon:yes stop_codon:yes gene_type:complete
MNFKESITYGRLSKQYGANLCYILEPWFRFVHMGKMHATDTNKLMYPGSRTTFGIGGLTGSAGLLNNPQTLSISSTSTEDVKNGLGASEIAIKGLNENGYPLEEKVALQGTTASYTVNKFFALNSINISGLGTKKSPVTVTPAVGDYAAQGNLTIRSDSGTFLAYIESGYDEWGGSSYTVNAGEVLYLTNIKFDVTGTEDPQSTGVYDWQLWGSTMYGGGGKGARFGQKLLIKGSASSSKTYKHDFIEPLIFNEFESFWILIPAVTGTIQPTAYFNGYSTSIDRIGEYNKGNKSLYDSRYRNPNTKSALWTVKGNKWRNDGTNENY